MSPRITAAALGMILIAAMSVQFLPGASAEPIISDLSTGNPVTGGTFTVTVNVFYEQAIDGVNIYPYFITNGGFTTVTASPMTPMSGDNYEATLDIPNNAMELKYSVIARYNNSMSGKTTDVITRPVDDNVPPTASCEANVTLGMGDTHRFNGSGSTDNVGIANYTWTFGYGGGTVRLYGPNPEFQFLIPGEYQGTLAVKDFRNNAGTATFIIAVADTQPPVADAGLQTQVTAGEMLYLDGSASWDNVGIANYTWQFTYNGAPVTLYGDSPEYVFTTPGTYEISLTVSDAAGNTDTTVIQMDVLERQNGSGGVGWWVYALIIMVFLIAVMAIIILRM